MTQGAKGVLDAYEALSQEEREVVFAELIRRSAKSDHEVPDEIELTEIADQVFLGYDRSENSD